MNALKSLTNIKYLIWLLSTFVLELKADLELTIKDTKNKLQNITVLIDIPLTEVFKFFQN